MSDLEPVQAAVATTGTPVPFTDALALLREAVTRIADTHWEDT